jgi:hypothetical protein
MERQAARKEMGGEGKEGTKKEGRKKEGKERSRKKEKGMPCR